MNESATTEKHTTLYNRLIAMWVISEAVAGGIFHAVKLPGSGMIVGGFAVICICLIGFYNPTRGAIIKATVVVAIFKMMLTPYSPATAYIAVFFQGLVGELLFSIHGNRKFLSVILAVLALVESAIQRILVLTIIYGTAMWKAVDEFIKKLVGGENNNYSRYIAIAYVVMHVIAGIAIGIFAAGIPSRLERWKHENTAYLIADMEDQKMFLTSGKKKKKFRLWFAVTLILLLVFFVQSQLAPAHPWIPNSLVLHILIRSIIIVLLWYLVLAPVFLKLIKNWLEKKKSQNNPAIESVTKLLPSTRYIFTRSWQMTSNYRGYRRIKEWGKAVLINCL